MTTRAHDEVVGLHEFFVQWLTGTLEASDAAFGRFTDALHPAFTMIVPSGELFDRPAVIASLRAAHATVDEPFAIEIREIVDRVVGKDAVVVTYEEWHFVAGRTDSRRMSTAVFVPATDASSGVQWLHLHETFHEVGAGDAQSSGG